MRSIGATSWRASAAITLPGDGASDPPRVLSIGVVEQSRERSAPTTDARVMTGGIAPRSDEQLGGAHLDGIDDGDGGDGRAGTDRRVQAVDGDQRVGVGRAQVDDQVGLVEQPAADGRVRLVRHRLGDGGDGDHPQAAAPGAAGHLDRDGGQATGREDHHHVLRAEREVGQDHLGQARACAR